eukprot:TRINITY_DN2938_c0_g1_i1.p1 TRINITY_DN2938_c0_g1~~TRINITY_DN2938_c0_g1_i1.p1  ORF type:complete len:159 (+),score=24.23 TRINITY_DN2938_c0_g1_i1:149-625(+)
MSRPPLSFHYSTPSPPPSTTTTNTTNTTTTTTDNTTTTTTTSSSSSSIPSPQTLLSHFSTSTSFTQQQPELKAKIDALPEGAKALLKTAEYRRMIESRIFETQQLLLNVPVANKFLIDCVMCCKFSRALFLRTVHSHILIPSHPLCRNDSYHRKSMTR